VRAPDGVAVSGDRATRSQCRAGIRQRCDLRADVLSAISAPRLPSSWVLARMRTGNDPHERFIDEEEDGVRKPTEERPAVVQVDLGKAPRCVEHGIESLIHRIEKLES
jgi:hypothetical protein